MKIPKEKVSVKHKKQVPYFSNPEDPDFKKKRNEELEKMGIHNHKLPSFTND